jgi:DNA mismatch repair protein MutH
VLQQKYDKTSIESIVGYSKLLTGKTLNEVVTLPHSVANSRNKGDLGGMIEAHFFELPPTNKGIDFPEAGLELKTTGLLRRSDGSLKAKERLVLTKINYCDIAKEEWEFSAFLSKCKMMLILFYLYDKEVPSFDQRFILDPILFSLEEQDIATIRRDWEFIRNQVRAGKAHELSEGDTFYLGACRKGSGKEDEKLMDQPFSDQKAKSRAFSFKASYVNLLINGRKEIDVLGLDEVVTFEEATAARFEPFFGMSLGDIAKRFGYQKKSPKSFTRQLAMRIISNGGESVPELEKAGVELKTVRLNKKGRPREAMSFPGFKPLEIIDEDWENSNFFHRIESRFLFVVFRQDEDGIERLESAVYWNMPYLDRLEAKRVWEETKKRIIDNVPNLPRSSESHVAHVRPKAKNALDTWPTPQGGTRVKQCFWLNRDYIREVLSAINIMSDPKA